MDDDLEYEECDEWGHCSCYDPELGLMCCHCGSYPPEPEPLHDTREERDGWR